MKGRGKKIVSLPGRRKYFWRFNRCCKSSRMATRIAHFVIENTIPFVTLSLSLSLSLSHPSRAHSFRDDKSAKIDGGDTEKFNFLADSIIRGGGGEPPRRRFQEAGNDACPILREMIIEFLSRDPSVRGRTWRIPRVFIGVSTNVIVYRVRLSGRSSAKIAAALGHTIQDGRDANFPTWWHLRIELDRILPNSIRSNPLSLSPSPSPSLSISPLSTFFPSLDFTKSKSVLMSFVFPTAMENG